MWNRLSTPHHHLCTANIPLLARKMSAAKDIIPRADKVSRSVSNSWSASQIPAARAAQLSTSPSLALHSPPNLTGGPFGAMAHRSKSLTRFATGDMRVLLLENVNATGQDLLRAQGYQVEALTTSLGEDELVERIKDVHVLGIRSKTKVTARVLEAARNLLAVGCFCIGTDQVDLRDAGARGVAVFNSPFSNSRSVAELTLAEVVMLARQAFDRSAEIHQGRWMKVSAGCWEVRGKTLGIVGYGHIGSQLSVLAEALGLRVLYHDVVPLMALGSARQVKSLDELLARSDFVSLHVPDRADTKGMIGAAQLETMRDGAYLINNARGSLVDMRALVDALRRGKLAGAALDVYPAEPRANGDYFASKHLSKPAEGEQALDTWADDLRGLRNVILTPHIGGSTEEAQSAIGVEVGSALVRYVNEGTTLGAVNLPEVALRSLTPEDVGFARVIFIHKNIPGVLRRVNEILSDHNVHKQMTDSKGDVAYLMADVSNVSQAQIKSLWQDLEDMSSRIRTRILY